jgi:DNA-binding beta-propeller fold protein YncE
MASDASGNIYVADRNNQRIQKFDPDGEFITKWGIFGDADGDFLYPIEVAADAQGNVYVVDQKSPRLQKFDSEGNFVTTWGDYGRGNGEFHLGLKGSQQYYVSLYAWVARVRFHRRRIPLL